MATARNLGNWDGPRTAALLLVLSGVIADTAQARTETGPFGRDVPGGTDSDATLARDPPLWDDLGRLTHPVTTANPLAQRYFDQGLRLAYAFNHAEARRAFRAAQRHDPGCAMAFWGEALVLGPNINAPMNPTDGASALTAVAQARARAATASPSEQALIAALSTRYSADPKADRIVLDRAYADAMAALTARYPDDDDIAVLAAEALMDLSPWDYWQDGGTKPKGHTEQIVAMLQRVLQRNPEHPGAIHLYIHIVEASTDPGRAEPHAERLAGLMPGAGHLVHMPSHIFFRVGRYRDSLATNQAAVATDERYLAQASAKGIYPGGYYPHNVHFLMVSAQMAGDGPTALQAAEKLARMAAEGRMADAAWVQPIMAAPYFVHAQFGDAGTVAKVADPGDRLPYVKAMWLYLRGVTAVRQGDFPAAEAAAAAIDDLTRSGDFNALEAAGVPGKSVLELAAHVVRARRAQHRGDLAGAVSQFEAAIALEDQLPYLEPPFWYYPVRQSLGAAKLQSGDLEGAIAAFRKSLEQAPQNGWTLYGLAEAYRQAGKREDADETQARFRRAWLGRQGPPRLDQL
ncbi:tetratricopeptide repeat protein [Methylolobus aquaticus]